MPLRLHQRSEGTASVCDFPSFCIPFFLTCHKSILLYIYLNCFPPPLILFCDTIQRVRTTKYNYAMNHGMIETARRLRISIRCRHLENCRLGQHQRRSLASQNEHESPPKGEAQAQAQAHKPSASSLRKWEGAAHRQRREIPEQRRVAE
jgi:hypothetical protein